MDFCILNPHLVCHYMHDFNEYNIIWISGLSVLFFFHDTTIRMKKPIKNHKCHTERNGRARGNSKIVNIVI